MIWGPCWGTTIGGFGDFFPEKIPDVFHEVLERIGIKIVQAGF